MSPEHFLDLARVLPEPLLMLTSQGEIMAANKLASSLFGLSIKEIVGKMLSDLVSESVTHVNQYLLLCSRSRSLVIGNLTNRFSEDKEEVYRCAGGLIKQGSPSLILLRLESKKLADQNFAVLNQKIDALSQEIHQRKQAELILKKTNESLEKTMRDLQAAQSQLVQSEKMSALGQMVAGIAHEINNPLTFIQGNINYIDQSTHDLFDLIDAYHSALPNLPEEIQEKIEEIDLDFLKDDLPYILNSIRNGTLRISEIVQALRTFSKLDEVGLKRIDLHENIDSILVILKNRLQLQKNGHLVNIQVIKEYGDLPQINCYAGLLNQAIMNIINNSIEALQELVNQKPNDDQIKNCGHCGQYIPTIKISTETHGGQRIIVKIFDNGIGIQEEMMNKIFDPFFTTKPVGQGTGLGLAITYNIITKKHQGSVRCFSTWGKGTEFRIELPSGLNTNLSD